MIQSKPSSVTIEEAVARMVNMDYIPTGFTLLEMTDAFREEAEVEYENAKIDNLPENKIAPLRVRMESCSARHSLAQQFLESLRHEAKYPEGSMVIVADDSSSQVRLTLESVSEWAADRYGIGIPECSAKASVNDDNLKDVRWENVIIKIYKNDRIAYSFGEGKYTKSTFEKIGLFDKRKNEPNHQAGILLALSKKIKYPKRAVLSNSEKAAISKLRRALKLLTGISSDPFQPFNEIDGWIPRFKLDNDSRNAEERAKDKAIHVSTSHELDKYSFQKWSEEKNIAEARDYEIESDPAQEFINTMEKKLPVTPDD